MKIGKTNLFDLILWSDDKFYRKSVKLNSIIAHANMFRLEWDRVSDTKYHQE